MTFTLPVAGWLMGTTDVERGLLGTIFNGYSETHVKRRARLLPAEAVTPDGGTADSRPAQ